MPARIWGWVIFQELNEILENLGEVCVGSGFGLEEMCPNFRSS